MLGYTEGKKINIILVGCRAKSCGKENINYIMSDG